MKTQTIEVEGLPEGWKAVAYRLPRSGDYYLRYGKITFAHDDAFTIEYLIVEKIQPLRIVLEETNRDNTLYASGNYETQVFNNGLRLFNNPRIWREVKETDQEPHLKLSKKDMLELIEHIKLGGQLNYKIAEFINYEQPEPKLSLCVCECKGLFEGNQPAINKVKEFIKENS